MWTAMWKLVSRFHMAITDVIELLKRLQNRYRRYITVTERLQTVTQSDVDVDVQLEVHQAF